MFPVYIKKPKTNPPHADIHYIIAKNGIFLKKKNDWIDAIIPVKQIAILEEQITKAEILLPNISRTVMAKAFKFFKAVYDKYKTEAAVLLHYSNEKGWEVSVPLQKVTPSRVDYDSMERLDGYNCVGTIHSHGSMSAFHSSADIKDEEQHDGIHITIGDMDKEDSFSMSAEVVINGTRFVFRSSQIEGLEKLESEKKYFWQNKSEYYSITCPLLDNWVVPEEWMNKVEKKIFVIYTVPLTAYTGEYPYSYGYGCREHVSSNSKDTEENKGVKSEN